MSTIIAEARVGLLGHQGSGKTCFMYGMYNAFSDFAQRIPFTLFTQDENDDDLFREVWEKVEEGWVPPGNDENPVTYLLELRDGLRPLINMAWIDYRGQALRSDATEEEKKALRDQLVGSECLFLCVESETLQSPSARDKNKIARLGALTRDLPAIPLVILMTKADLFDLPGQKSEPGPTPAVTSPPTTGLGPAPLPAIDPAIEELVRAKFHPWFEQDRPIMISPVSIRPANRYFRYLPAPFAFAAYHIVRAKHAEKAELLRLDDARLEKRTGGVQSFWYYLGQRTTRELREKIRGDKETLADFEKKMASLESYFSRASIYQKHERVTLSGEKRQAPR